MMEDLPFETSVQLRFRDLDALGHVNHAVYVTYLESARHAFYEAIRPEDSSVQYVIASLDVEYEHPIGADDSLVVGLGTTALSESTVTLTYALRANGRRAATAQTVQVAYDEATGQSRSLPEAWREAFATYRCDAER